MPSPAPSITGAVSIIELSKVVNETLNETDITAITAEVASAYGVDEDDISVDVVYETTGSLDLNVSGTVDEATLADALEEELASILGIHEGDVSVEIDEDGTATYIITSDSVEGAKAAIDILASDNTSAIVSESIGEAFPTVDVDGVDVDGTITQSDIKVQANLLIE